MNKFKNFIKLIIIDIKIKNIEDIKEMVELLNNKKEILQKLSGLHISLLKGGE